MRILKETYDNKDKEVVRDLLIKYRGDLGRGNIRGLVKDSIEAAAPDYIFSNSVYSLVTVLLNKNMEQEQMLDVLGKSFGEIPYFFFCNYNNDPNWFSVKNVIIPDTVKKIREHAFRNCNIETVFIPSSVSIIGFGAFGSCTNLERVTLSDGIQDIEALAFHDTKITDIEIPGSVKKITKDALFGMYNLQNIIFHEGVNTIEAQELTPGSTVYITMPDSVQLIDKDITDNRKSHNDKYKNRAIIKCHEGSYAHKWAKDNRYKVEII